MGANAVTTTYDFTAGQILTAAQMDNVNCGIPVFATTTTRDAAFGTGKKTLAEGQFAYIEATNTTQYYDGSAWQSVGGGSFVLVSSGSVSAAAAITLDSVFTSTYRNYKMFINGTCSADDSDITFRFRAGGSTNSANSYSRKIISAGASTVTTSAATGQTSFTSFMATGLTQVVNETVFFAPQVAIATGIQYMSGAVSTNNYQYWGSGVFTNTTQFDGLVITPVSGTITAQYRIYGLAD